MFCYKKIQIKQKSPDTDTGIKKAPAWNMGHGTGFAAVQSDLPVPIPPVRTCQGFDWYNLLIDGTCFPPKSPFFSLKCKLQELFLLDPFLIGLFCWQHLFTGFRIRSRRLRLFMGWLVQQARNTKHNSQENYEPMTFKKYFDILAVMSHRHPAQSNHKV